MTTEQAEPRYKEGAPTISARGVLSELGPETDREILGTLVANPALHVMEIAYTADRHPITVDQTCARLHEQGQIRPVGRGLYEITDNGKRRIGDDPES